MDSHKNLASPRPAVPPAGEPLTRAMSLDPGGTTGYAICVIDNVNSIRIGWDQARLSESALMELLETVQPDVIICEDFEYRNKARAGLDLTPPRLIGVVKLYAQGNCKLKLQKAAVGKGHYSDQRLRSFDLYRRGTPHGRDALRHLLHWLTFGGGNAYIDLLSVNINLVDIDVLLDGSFGRNNT
jgi:hypothetical protein